MNENKKNIQNISFDQNIQKELRYFKDDILKDFKKIETKIIQNSMKKTKTLKKNFFNLI